MKYQGVIKKSRTLDAAALLGIFGAIQATLPGLGLDPSTVGYINMGLAVAIAYLRFKTNGPVGQK